MNRLHDYLSRGPVATAGAEAGHAAFLNELTAALESEIERHFRFEEVELFPRLVEAGEPGIGTLLLDEHNIMSPWGDDLISLGRAAIDDSWNERTWARFHEVGTGFSSMLLSHIQKETMGFLPLLDEILDDETDSALAVDYAEG